MALRTAVLAFVSTLLGALLLVVFLREEGSLLGEISAPTRALSEKGSKGQPHPGHERIAARIEIEHLADKAEAEAQAEAEAAAEAEAEAKAEAEDALEIADEEANLWNKQEQAADEAAAEDVEAEADDMQDAEDDEAEAEAATPAAAAAGTPAPVDSTAAATTAAPIVAATTTTAAPIVVAATTTAAPAIVVAATTTANVAPAATTALPTTTAAKQNKAKLLFPKIATDSDGVEIDLRITPAPGEDAHVSKGETFDGLGSITAFGSINCFTNARSSFIGTLCKSGTEELVTMPMFAVTFYDIDSTKDEYPEKVTVYGYDSYAMGDGHEKYYTVEEEIKRGRLSVTASSIKSGDRSDNPVSVGSLTDVQRARSLTVVFKDKSSFAFDFDLTGVPQSLTADLRVWADRSLLFSLKEEIVPPKEKSESAQTATKGADEKKKGDASDEKDLVHLKAQEEKLGEEDEALEAKAKKFKATWNVDHPLPETEKEIKKIKAKLKEIEKEESEAAKPVDLNVSQIPRIFGGMLAFLLVLIGISSMLDFLGCWPVDLDTYKRPAEGSVSHTFPELNGLDSRTLTLSRGLE